MIDRENVIENLEQNIRWIEEIECHQFPGWGNVTMAMRDALELLKEQDALLNKIYDNVSKWGLDSPCDDLVCDDGWCEEHCERDGTKPECIERWFKYLLKKDGEVDD